MGTSSVNLPQMPLDSGGICTGADLRNHPSSPGLPPERHLKNVNFCDAEVDDVEPRVLHRVPDLPKPCQSHMKRELT